MNQPPRPRFARRQGTQTMSRLRGSQCRETPSAAWNEQPVYALSAFVGQLSLDPVHAIAKIAELSLNRSQRAEDGIVLLVGTWLEILSVQHLGQVIRWPAQRLRQGCQGLRPPSARIDVVLQLAQGRQRDPRLGGYLHLSRAQFSQATADRARNSCPVLCHVSSREVGWIKVSGGIGANRAQDDRMGLTVMPIEINIGTNIRPAAAAELAHGGAMTTATSLDRGHGFQAAGLHAESPPQVQQGRAG